MGLKNTYWLFMLAGGTAFFACLPLFASPYTVSLMLSIFSYVIMATAWSMFSGSTRYVSLATAAFFGIGAYMSAIYAETLPFPLVVIIGAAAGFGIALIVGLSTLRLSGVYFVVFTFGLSELIRQFMIWFEINQTRTLVRHVFLDIWPEDLYYYLLVVLVITLATAYLIGRSRLGLALRTIGEDESAANHAGINTMLVKVLMFALSAAFISAAGAILMPRWTYIDPNIAFNPLLSFQVLIMALLGGVSRVWGPALGAVPLVLLFEFLSGEFPRQFSIVLGGCFIFIVYFLPHGASAVLENVFNKLKRKISAEAN